MKELILTIPLTIGMLVWACFNKSTLKEPLLDVSLGLAVGIFIKLAINIWSEWGRVKLILTSLFINPNTELRISIAYLFIITIKGKYFLIKNHRGQPGYQPVGGVYKFLKDENAELFNNLGMIPDHNIPVDDESNNDLRMRLKERWKLFEFLRWFKSRKNREVNPWREFYEELIADNIIDGSFFPYIQYNLCKTNFSEIQRSAKFPIDEFFYADVYELKFENDKQYNVFENLLTKESDNYIFVTPAEINNGYSNNGKVILPHTKKILP